jgi:hypothetical protein
VKRPSILAALAIFALAVTSGGARAVVPGIPSIYVTYAPDCTFTMSADPASSITSSATLLPGKWQLVIFMPNPSSGYQACPRPNFTFTGPGVGISSVFPGAELNDDDVATLQPSSTYVAQDENAPGSSRRVITTAASGSSVSLVSPSPGTSKGPSTGSPQPDIVGSGLLPYRGRLTAVVPAAGKPTLGLGGKAVTSLKAGKYDVAVVDRSRRAGLAVRRTGGDAVSLTAWAFVGSRTTRVSLRRGRWTFSSAHGTITVTVT